MGLRRRLVPVCGFSWCGPLGPIIFGGSQYLPLLITCR
jgi:hypothetical protein